MKFASLGSGSEGNALLVRSGAAHDATTVMLDCGFGLRETERRLERLGVDPASLSGVLVTHEHSDHVGGVFKLARRYRIPVWLSHGTWQAVRDDAKGVEVGFCSDSTPLSVGTLEFLPYTVPHDAREPLQFVASDGERRLGVLTDAGQPTPHLVAALDACDALLLESNHDRQMLAHSAYPQSLKNRIGGPFGHLSNDSAAEILAALDRRRLKRVVGAHLSRQNNTPELVEAAILSALAGDAVEVVVACQDDGFGWLDCR